jgi:hypothetical protein
MSYNSSGPKPFERASKSSHHHLINDPAVVAVVEDLHVPPQSDVGDLKALLTTFLPVDSKVEHVVAIDGGYTEIPIRSSFPSASMHFFQFGALHFKLDDLKKLGIGMHVAPEDMQKLKNIERLKLPLPTRGARSKKFKTLRDSIRFSLHSFLQRECLGEDNSLLDTLAWFLFHRYKIGDRAPEEGEWYLSSNPYDVPGGLTLQDDAMSPDFTFKCPTTNQPIYLTDIFRLHERIEEEQGAAGIAGYVAGAVEHLILLHVIKNLLRKDPSTLKTVFFVMDRPTGWFGVTAPLHKPTLDLSKWLFASHALYLVGLEKSGAFVEHAKAIQLHMPAGTFLILNDAYIYKYISPGSEDSARPYAATSYYGHKLIFKSRSGQMYVASVPVSELRKTPTVADLPNVQLILTHVEQLHCDMYENALLPVALANKLVSLSAHPSSQILKSFVKSTLTEA